VGQKKNVGLTLSFVRILFEHTRGCFKCDSETILVFWKGFLFICLTEYHSVFLLYLAGCLRFFKNSISYTVWYRRPPPWSIGQSSWLQIQRSRVRIPALPHFLRSGGSGTGSTQPREDNWGATWMEKVAAPVLKSEINGRGDPLRWPRDTLYRQKLALILPTSGGRSVGIVRLLTKSHGVLVFFSLVWYRQMRPPVDSTLGEAVRNLIVHTEIFIQSAVQLFVQEWRLENIWFIRLCICAFIYVWLLLTANNFT
jgi:hypothetical protein